MAQAMEAETLGEATETEGLWSFDDHAGELFSFRGATFADSDLPGEIPLYAIVEAVHLASGELVRVACGGTRVVTTLFRGMEKRWYPFDASIVSVPLGGGKSALNLVPAPKRVTNEADS